MTDTAQHPETPSFAFLAPTREEIDRVLSWIPETRLEARRTVTREWGLDPTPAELQTVVGLAHHPVGEEQPTRELARTILAARVFVERALRPLLSSEQFDFVRIRETARRLPVFAAAVDALDAQLRAAGEAVAPGEREFVVRVGTLLAPLRDAIVAASVLAPHLERLARVMDAEEIRSALPRLNDAEVAMLASVLCPEPGGERHPGRTGDPSRLCVDAVLLSAVIRGDLALAEQASTPAESPAHPQELVERLVRDKIVYHVVAGRLQQQQDAALLAGLTDYVETLRRAQLGLFEAYRELAATLNTSAAGSADGTDESATEIRRLLEESAVQDALADSERSERVSEEELYLDALKDVDAPRVTRKSRVKSTHDSKSERLRIRVLSTALLVLFATCAGVWGMRLLGGGSDPLAVPLAEMSETLILDEAISVGPMMYAVVSHWSWDDMSDEERLSRVRALGLSAANEGYETVYLVDENREELAMWSKNRGARLMGSDAPTAPANPS